jgi:hypothetical protein
MSEFSNEADNLQGQKGNGVLPCVSGSLIEWQYVSLAGHYGYWVIKANKSKFEKEEMTADKETKWFKIGENPNYTHPAFFSVHSVNSLEKRQFSIIHANIDNTPEKVELARSFYPKEDFHFEFHSCKYDMKPVIAKH